jgi:hypothetical protein
MFAFALTIFTGAFLLFQVQPLIGKYILPWFGGSPGVWTTCMLFFQMLLLGGYAYAHTVSRRLKPRTQAVVHVILLVAALATLPITPSDSWKTHTGENPTWHILALLAVSLGLPYIVLSATGPLMQEWFRRVSPGVSPYRLYALSNVGSLLALISYPFYFESHFTRRAQAQFWSWALLGYALCAGWCAWRVWKSGTGVSPVENETTGGTPVPRTHRLLWIALPACASILLLAVTNKMCQDVAVIPFLWVLPLALYLLSFIISFDSPRWYSRFYYTVALAGAMVAVCLALFAGADMAMKDQILIYSGTLFVGCMICHGELYRLKPDPRHLTSFYLMIAAGGAIGGLFVALVAPHVFSNFYELHFSLALTVLLLVVVSFVDRTALKSWQWRTLFGLLALGAAYGIDRGMLWGITQLRHRDAVQGKSLFASMNWTQVERLRWIVWVAVAVAVVGIWLIRRRRRAPALNWPLLTGGLLSGGLVALIVALGMQVHSSLRNSLFSARNFYGVLSVFEYLDTGSASRYRLLLHGRITHGLQFSAPERAREITSYFGASSGLGLALRHFPRQQNQRIGLLGLGVGTITAYGKPGDYIRVYEINPQVKQIAEDPFTYVANSRAQVEIVMGDGRLSMESEPPQNFDILIMDAFSSDAVPVHLLTKEAFEIYQRHLKPDGAIVVNISNRYLDLRPVIENAAREFGFQSHHINCEDGAGGDDDEGSWWLYASSWMILSKNQAFMDRNELKWAASPTAASTNIPLWTDDYTSMFKILQ